MLSDDRRTIIYIITSRAGTMAADGAAIGC
jgi:hypothetical protein